MSQTEHEGPDAPIANVDPGGSVSVTALSANVQSSLLVPDAAQTSQTNISSHTAPQMFALVIGINEYKSTAIRDLQGCVNDVQSFKLFLKQRLVPDSHIVYLVNAAATRQNILSNIQSHLIKNPDIKEGDAILFYFAGHGSRVRCPPSWPSTNGQIETICPCDEGEDSPEDPEGNIICGIPDRTLNVLFRMLAAEKGNNITTIFDCCHSGGMARDREEPADCRPRFLSNPWPVTDNVDKDILEGSYAPRNSKLSIPPGFRYPAMATHVFLAACKQEERALECPFGDGSHGAFSYRLLEALQSMLLESTTYIDLVKRLGPLTGQTPQCEGVNKNRILFSSRAIIEDPRSFSLSEAPSGMFHIDAGKVHGVTVGTRFLVQTLNQEAPILVAKTVDTTSAILAWPEASMGCDLPPGTTALIRDPLVLKVFVDSKKYPHIAAHLPLPTVSGDTDGLNVVRVKSRLEAAIVIEQDSDEDLYIERLDDLIASYAERRIRGPTGVSLTRLPSILEAICHFNFHLGRNHGPNMYRDVSKHTTNDPMSGVTMELYDLVTPASGDFPVCGEQNYLIENKAMLTYSDGALHAVALINSTDYDLFPYLFYFDPATYEIQEFYSPPSQDMSPPLRKRSLFYEPGKLIVGHCIHGTDPIEFYLERDKEWDTGLLKLFVSEEYVDMKWIVQESWSRGQHRTARQSKKKGGRWGAWVAAVKVVREMVDEHMMH